ncbi:MAG: hypothetical protein JWN40_2407 [Phycisphaerales bacterium]|nr:hypothetical protein [Phycisphaerales bacterium]
MLLQRRRASNALRHDAQRANPLYGYDYNPVWPSILSIAHDETDGGALFIITDRPCVLGGAGNVLPLTVASLDIVNGAMILPVKFRMVMSGAVPLGAAWQWGTSASDLYDPVTFHAPNAASGNCADVPGPYTPPAAVTGTSISGNTCTLVFDRPIILSGAPLDDAMTFNGYAPNGVTSAGPNTLDLDCPVALNPGDPWAITRQPPWITTPIAWPQGGTL